jgi:hypothetical protein
MFDRDTLAAVRAHDTKFADMPRVRGRVIPTPDGHPTRQADETTAEIIADLWFLADASRRVLEAVKAGARVTPLPDEAGGPCPW